MTDAQTLEDLCVRLGDACILARLQRIVAVHLIGSCSTGEFRSEPGTSDVDLLLTVEDGLSADCVAGQVSRLGQVLGRTRNVGTRHGIRYRYVRELDGFSRYLALQGYAAESAMCVWSASGLPVGLPPPDRSAPSGDEFVCVFLESLWADIRAGHLGAQVPAVQNYLHSKSLLSYANLLLIASGRFLPTHAARVEAFVGADGDGDAALLTALRFKTGATPSTDLDTTVMCARQSYRRRCLRIALSAVTGDHLRLDPLQFWFDAEAPLAPAERLRAAQETCRSLFRLLLHGSNAPQGEVASWIHARRILLSCWSRRDWAYKPLAN